MYVSFFFFFFFFLGLGLGCIEFQCYLNTQNRTHLITLYLVERTIPLQVGSVYIRKCVNNCVNFVYLNNIIHLFLLEHYSYITQYM